MDKDTLEKLAYLSLISNSIGNILSSGGGNIPKATLHKLAPVKAKIDNEFVSLILNAPTLADKDEKAISERLAEEKAKIKSKSKNVVTKRVSEEE
jgi:hypothetical protein